MATLSSTRVESSKVKIPEPKSFSGLRSVKELENFIWDMEQYFTAARVPDANKLNITTMYLSGDAKLWWSTRNADDVISGCPRMDTWDKLIKEMRDQFVPSNASLLAMRINFTTSFRVCKAGLKTNYEGRMLKICPGNCCCRFVGGFLDDSSFDKSSLHFKN